MPFIGQVPGKLCSKAKSQDTMFYFTDVTSRYNCQLSHVAKQLCMLLRTLLTDFRRQLFSCNTVGCLHHIELLPLHPNRKTLMQGVRINVLPICRRAEFMWGSYPIQTYQITSSFSRQHFQPFIYAAYLILDFCTQRGICSCKYGEISYIGFW